MNHIFKQAWISLILVSSSYSIIFGSESKPHYLYSTETTDAYLQLAAITSPQYRADIHPIKRDTNIAFGLIEGFSPIIGRFTFRAKHFNELTESMRNYLTTDYAFKQFEKDYGIHFIISPEDFLSSDILTLKLNKNE
jgi:hypothetical protein